MEAGPSSAPPTKRRTRIPQAGIVIMEAFLNSKGLYPTREERYAMLCQIRSIPGGENYDDKSVRAWFKRRRTSHTHEPQKASNPSYPSLSVEDLENLAVLARNTPFPPQSLINTWAVLLTATPEDVTKWLAEHRSPVHHLPTPVSASPEPAAEYQCQWEVLKRDPTHSPIIPSSSSHNFPSLIEEPPTLSDELLIDAIIEANSERGHPINDIQPPTTLEQFESLFQSYQTRMESIICQNEEIMCS